jgi:hypothetical protein
MSKNAINETANKTKTRLSSRPTIYRPKRRLLAMCHDHELQEPVD